MTLVFLVLFGLMLIGVPVAFSILSAGMTYLVLTGVRSLVVTQRLVYGLNSFTLLAVPLFILVGNLMDFGGISRRLTDWAKSLLGWMPGGLGIVTVFSCAIFAALTGSGPATVAAIGSIMLPSMVKAGYSRETSAGLVASAGALGPIIPPSMPMIIYGVTMNLSIPAMFVGGVVPGLVIALVLSAVNVVFALRNPEVLKYSRQTKFDLGESLRLFWKALGALGLPVLILGGIYGGIFTPTESAAIGVVYALILGFALKELKVKDLPKILINSLKTSTMVNFIIAAASLFSWVVSNFGISVIISIAAPILQVMFPVLIVLTVLRLLRKHIKSNFVYTITSGMTAFVALTDTISGLTGVPLGTEHLPLADMGFGWVVPAVIASLISLLISYDNTKNSGR